MSRTKEAAKRRRKRKLVPAALGAAGLSLSMASGACAASAAPAAEALAQTSTASRDVILADEEVCDVSLATFHVFDKEAAGTVRPRARFAMAACGGCGCASCAGACWTGTYYTSSVFGDHANPPPPAAKPAHKHKPTHKRKP